MQRRHLLALATAGLVGASLVSGVSAQEKKTLALVTNASADFWTIARRGTEKAAAELPNYNVEMYVVVRGDRGRAAAHPRQPAHQGRRRRLDQRRSIPPTRPTS